MKTQIKYRIKSCLTTLEVSRRVKTEMGLMIITPTKAEQQLACRVELLRQLLTLNYN